MTRVEIAPEQAYSIGSLVDGLRRFQVEDIGAWYVPFADGTGAEEFGNPSDLGWLEFLSLLITSGRWAHGSVLIEGDIVDQGFEVTIHISPSGFND